MTSAQDQAKRIKLLLLDVDGVLTDGKLYFDNQGNEMKAFNTQDGHGIKLLQKSGVKVGIITGRKSDLVARRAGDLGITILVQGREDKFIALQEILRNDPMPLEHIAFMGDDHPDLTCMVKVGLAMTTANAHPDVVAQAHWQSRRNGGEGAVREACDFLMQAQGTHQALLDTYIR